MKIFRFVKKVFFVGLTILSSFANADSLSAVSLNAIPLSCISMKNRKCKTRPQLLMLIVIIPYFTLLVLKRVNVVVIVIILTIRMQKVVFLML